MESQAGGSQFSNFAERDNVFTLVGMAIGTLSFHFVLRIEIIPDNVSDSSGIRYKNRPIRYENRSV